jgi:hypothetical protein
MGVCHCLSKNILKLTGELPDLCILSVIACNILLLHLFQKPPLVTC